MSRWNKTEAKLLHFAQNNPNEWHSYATDKKTEQAVAYCALKGELKVNKHHQFMCVRPEPAKPKAKIQVRYILDETLTGRPATITHQDDSETEITACSLANLISQMADWSDCGTDSILKAIKGDQYTDESGTAYTIKRELVKTTALTEQDFTRLAFIRAKDKAERERYRLQFNNPMINPSFSGTTGSHHKENQDAEAQSQDMGQEHPRNHRTQQ